MVSLLAMEACHGVMEVDSDKKHNALCFVQKNLNNGGKEYMCGRRVVAPSY